MNFLATFFRSTYASVVTAVVATFSVTTWFYVENVQLIEREHDLEIAECEGDFGSLKRALVSQNTLDWSKLFIEPSSDSIPAGTVFFEEGFYAKRDFPNLTYSKIDDIKEWEEESRVLMNLFPKIPEFEKTIKQGISAMKRSEFLPVSHYWKGSEKYKLHIEFAGSDGKTELRPYIAVSYLKFEDRRRLLSALQNQDEEQCRSSTIGPFRPSCDLDTSYKILGSKTYVKNALFYEMFDALKAVQILQAVADLDLGFRVNEVSREDDYDYLSYLVTASKIEVNGEVRQEAYLQGELLIAYTRDGIIRIEVFMPYLSHSEKASLSRRVTRWMSSLRIVLDSGR